MGFGQIMKNNPIVFTDTCYICGHKVIGHKNQFNVTWTTNFKGLTAHIRCIAKRKAIPAIIGDKRW
jgi:hypothetical protein